MNVYAKYENDKIVTIARCPQKGFIEIDEQSKEVQSFYNPPKTYKELRVYPTLEEQLDMQYWDKVNGTNNWQAEINAIKIKFPKD